MDGQIKEHNAMWLEVGAIAATKIYIGYSKAWVQWTIHWSS